jgi:hypothetical protein
VGLSAFYQQLATRNQQLFPRIPMRHRHTGLHTLSPGYRPVDTIPTHPANATIVRVFMTYEGGVIVLFDRPVIVDLVTPPTTWTFGGAFSLQPGGFNFDNGVYLIPNGTVGPGDAVTIGANDPAARTPEGGTVNGGTLVVVDL